MIVDESVVVDPLDPVAITDTLDDVAYWNIETSLSQVIPAEDATRMIVVLSRVDVANIELKVWDRENQIKWSNSGTATEGIFIMTDDTSKVTARQKLDIYWNSNVVPIVEVSLSSATKLISTGIVAALALVSF